MRVSYRVLIAANDQNFFAFLRDRLFEDPEWDLIGCAGDGLQALALTRDWLPDAVIMDAYLPVLDCAAYLNRLLAEDVHKLPFVAAVTAPTLIRTTGYLLEMGADALWPKTDCVEGLRRLKQDVRAKPFSKLALARLDSRMNACSLLLQRMGMNSALLGFAYLACAAAFASINLELCKNLSSGIYRWVAQRYDTTPVLVERAIRHAIESTVNRASPQLLYAAFGNTMDPQRGKPTNSEMIAVLAQRIRIECEKERCADDKTTL